MLNPLSGAAARDANNFLLTEQNSAIFSPAPRRAAASGLASPTAAASASDKALAAKNTVVAANSTQDAAVQHAEQQRLRADAAAAEARARMWKTLYAFVCITMPLAVVASLSLALGSSEWFEVLAPALAKATSGEAAAAAESLAAFFKLPATHTFVALGPISQNSTCTPLVFVGPATLFYADTLLSTLRVLTSQSASDQVLLQQQLPFGCRDLGDAITAASRLAIGLATAIFIAGAVSCYELASYGPYGGSRSFGRVSFILSSVACAAALLLVVAWYFVGNVAFCDAKTLAQRGFVAGYPWYMAIGLLLALLVDLTQTARKMGRLQRGPPSMTILYRSVLLATACHLIFAQGFLQLPRGAAPQVDGGTGVLSLTGWAEACVAWPAEYPCPNLQLYATLLVVAVCITLGAALLCVLYTALRAVDHRGMTLVWSSGFGLVVVIFTIGIGVGIYSASTVNGQTCDRSERASVWDLGFELGTGSWMIVPALSSAVTFLAMNIAYSCKCVVQQAAGGDDPAAALGNVSAASASPSAVRGLVSMTESGLMDEDSPARARGPAPDSPRRGGGKRSRAGATKAVADAVDRATADGGGEAKVRRRYWYHLFWWDGLRDSRTTAILDREAQDANEAGGNDADAEVGDVAAAVGLDVEPPTPQQQQEQQQQQQNEQPSHGWLPNVSIVDESAVDVQTAAPGALSNRPNSFSAREQTRSPLASSGM